MNAVDAIEGESTPAVAGRVLLVEDEPAIAEPFSRALAREGFEAVVAPTIAAAREQLESERTVPDVILMDIALPDGDGRELAREVRARSSVPIIMVTARGSEIDRVVGLEMGADDYVVKPFSSAEVIARVRAVMRRSAARAAPATLVAGDIRLDPRSRRAWLDGGPLELTRKEFDLLARLMAGAGAVVTREDLMCDVWDVNWFGSTKTLDVHIAALRKKLGDPSGGGHIETVRGVGFRFTSDAEG